QKGWYPFQGSSVTIRGVSGAGGVLEFSLPATDNIEGALTTGGNIAGPFTIDLTTRKDLWFETRVRLDQVAETGLFVGLAQPGRAVTGSLANDTGALSD